MAEWLYEAGIGENRAILVEDGDIAEAAIELPGALGTGAVIDARLTNILIPGHRGIATLADGSEGLLEPLPSALTQGQSIRAEVVREPIWDGKVAKRPKLRCTEDALRPAPSLLQRLQASAAPVRHVRASDADAFEQAGWSELLECAETGEIAFEGGTLHIALTPAMTVIDVDGYLVPEALALAGARAAARAIRQLAITGSIGIDLPTLPSRTARQAAAEAFDALLPQPFERTAVNGFGFLQVVRKRERSSLVELVQGDPVGAAAGALLRRAERTGGAGQRTLSAAPAVIARISDAWRRELERRIGAPVVLRPDPTLSISRGHVQSVHP